MERVSCEVKCRYQGFGELLRKPEGWRPKTLVLAGAGDRKILEAVCRATEEHYISPILVGEPEAIRDLLARIDRPRIKDWRVVPAAGEDEICEAACETVLGEKDAFLMKGTVNTTGLLGSILRRKREFGIHGLVSHISLLELPYYRKLLGLSDTSINIAPTLEQKAQIIANSRDFFLRLGCGTPKIAVLSSVETVNEKMRDTLEAEELKKMGEQGLLGDCLVEGPISLDLSLDPSAAAVKRYAGKIRGDADILIAPDLTAGNLLGKSFNMTPDSRFAGFILGAGMPVGLTSRASSAENKFQTIAIGAMLLEGRENGESI